MTTMMAPNPSLGLRNNVAGEASGEGERGKKRFKVCNEWYCG
jgi:hypothetical protein